MRVQSDTKEEIFTTTSANKTAILENVFVRDVLNKKLLWMPNRVMFLHNFINIKNIINVFFKDINLLLLQDKHIAFLKF